MEEKDSFCYDEYETFDTLLENLPDIDHYLSEPETSRIRSVAASLIRMRQACADNARLNISELMQLFASLENVGSRGWSLVWARSRSYEKIWYELHAELHAKDKVLEDAKEKNRNLEEERDELVRQLSQVVDRLEPLAGQLNQVNMAQQSSISAPRPNPSESISNIDENANWFRAHDSAWEHEDATQDTENLSAWGASSIFTEAGSILEHPATSYPPPLAPATEEAREADERKTSMLSEVENMLWIQENKDRDYQVKTRVPIMKPPMSSPPIQLDPFYIYIPLPRNFTIPPNDPHLPSLVFPTPSSVFHFPECATRDQLLRILQQGCADGVGDQHLEPIEEINIIRVRTHGLEWELKNAIRKIMKGDEWDHLVGEDWPTEGRGDTYIVSKRDVHFEGVSRESGGRSHDSGSEESTGIMKGHDQQGANDRIQRKGLPKQRKDKGKEPDHTAQLRGGALSLSPICPGEASSHYSCVGQSGRSLAEYCGAKWLSSEHEDNPAELRQAWIDQARILQLQNTSHNRMLKHLQEIIKDTEETVLWQDEELMRAHRHIWDLERKVRERSEETHVAGRKADFARSETNLLREQLEQIHNQVSQFCTELDEHEQQILTHYPHLSTCESPQAVELRGGGDPPFKTASSSSIQSSASSQEEATIPAVGASSFYFFPSVSMVVLLSNPLHHFQFPKHTSLAQVRQMLHNLRTEGKETDPHLRQVRDIFEARDEAGISLPDTSNGRQILISAPIIADDSASIASGKPGFKGMWNRAFGPSEYQYEHMFKDSIESLKPPTTEDRSLPSPALSVYEEKFHESGILVDMVSHLGSPDNDEFYNAGDLIDSIEHEAEISRVRSAQKLTDLSKEVPKPRNRSDSLAEKRGYGMSLPLPPTTLGLMFPTGSGISCENQGLQRSVAPGNTVLEENLSLCPVGPSGVKAWRLDRHPPIETKRTHSDEFDRSAGLEYKQGSNDHSGLRRNPLSLERLFTNLSAETHDAEDRGFMEEGWGMWRHRKGEGCEAWMNPSGLNPSREICAFCDLPFVEKDWKKWEYDDGKAPTDQSKRSSDTSSSHKPRNQDFWEPNSGPPSPYLRGGAEEIEWDHLQNSTYDAANLGWMERMSPERPLSPRKKSLDKLDEDEAVLTMYGRCHPSCKRLVLQKHVSFAPGEDPVAGSSPVNSVNELTK